MAMGNAAVAHDDCVLTVTFEEALPGKTRLTLQQGAFPTTQARDGHRQGWNRALAAFQQFVAERR